MYSNLQLNLFREKGFNDSRFFQVVTRSEKLKQKLEKRLDVKLDKEAELEEYFHIEREVYEYQVLTKDEESARLADVII